MQIKNRVPAHSIPRMLRILIEMIYAVAFFYRIKKDFRKRSRILQLELLFFKEERHFDEYTGKFGAVGKRIFKPLCKAEYGIRSQEQTVRAV